MFLQGVASNGTFVLQFQNGLKAMRNLAPQSSEAC